MKTIFKIVGILVLFVLAAWVGKLAIGIIDWLLSMSMKYAWLVGAAVFVFAGLKWCQEWISRTSKRKR